MILVELLIHADRRTSFSPCVSYQGNILSTNSYTKSYIDPPKVSKISAPRSVFWWLRGPNSDSWRIQVIVCLLWALPGAVFPLNETMHSI